MKQLLIIAAAMLAVSCEYPCSADETFKPYTLCGLNITEPVYMGHGWDNYLNADHSIPESEKFENAQAVLRIVNERFKWVGDPEGQHVWNEMRLNNMSGDCKKHAMTCQKLLLSQSWKDSDVVLLSSFDHVVCGVVINGDMFLLDSLKKYIVPEVGSGYEWWEIFHNNRWYWCGEGGVRNEG